MVFPTTLTAVGEIKSSDKPTDFEELVLRWLEESSLRQMALLGDYGQGKSTAALALTYRILWNEAFAPLLARRIPILVRLTGLSPKSSTPEELLGAWGTRFGLNGRALVALHRAGRLLLIFDAFDEMANVGDRADRFDHFSMLWQFAGRSAKLLFTGRPNFFLDDEELKQALGIADGSHGGSYCTALRMASFSNDQIEGSLRWLPEAKIAEFMRAVSELPRLQEIVQRPSLLFQLAQLWSQGRINLSHENIQSASVIGAFLSYCIERQIAKQQGDIYSGRLERQFILLRESELRYFTCACAQAALGYGRNNTLPISVFRATIGHCYEQMDDSFLPPRATEKGALAMPLSERLRDRQDPVEACLHTVRTHGVIERDPSKSSVYKFSHKSFAEVLAGEVLVDRALHRVSPVIGAWNTNSSWRLVSQRTVFRMAIELVAARQGVSGGAG